MRDKAYQALLDKRADVGRAIDALADRIEAAGEISDADRAELDGHKAALATLNGDIERWEQVRAAQRSAPGVTLPAGAVITGGHNRAVDEPWGQRSGAPFGEFLQAVHRHAMGAGTDPRLTYQAAAQGAGEAIGSDGGFLVGGSMANRIMGRVVGGSVMSRLTRIPLDAGTDHIDINVIDETSRATGSRWGGVQGYWVDEGTAPTASRPKFSQISLRLRALGALGYAGNHLLKNASALQTIMEEAFAAELRWLVENSIVRGTGAGQPQGILNSSALVSVSKETGQGAATIVKENIDKMWARHYAPSRASSVWFINQDVEPQLDDLSMGVGTGGVPVYLPPGGLADTPFARLKGRPVVPVEYCSTLGTVGDIILADLSEYLFIEEAIEQAASMHVAFTTNEMAFRAMYYVDGQSAWKAALTPANGTNTLSPFVALATRS